MYLLEYYRAWFILVTPYWYLQLKINAMTYITLYRAHGHQESKISNGEATRFDNYGILLVTEVTSMHSDV